MQTPFRLLLLSALAAGSLAAQVAVAGENLTTRCDPPAGALARLSKSQKEAFLKSQDVFIAGRFAEALGEMRRLMAQVQNTAAQTALAERAAEAALEAGDRAYAISILKPIEARDESDCLARILLARAYAEDGRSAERDAVITASAALHAKGHRSPAVKLDAFTLERHKLKAGGTFGILYSLRPWGPQNTHLYSEIYDASGKFVVRIELDSADSDQVYFREVHPNLASKGERRYSLDAFGPNKEHASIRFFDGKPSYDEVRKLILEIAERAEAPTNR